MLDGHSPAGSSLRVLRSLLNIAINTSPGVRRAPSRVSGLISARCAVYGLINLKNEVLPEIGQSTELRPSVSG